MFNIMRYGHQHERVWRQISQRIDKLTIQIL